MKFFIDQVDSGSYSHTPTGGDFLPQTVFVSNRLTLENHTLVIQNGLAGSGTSLVILDSITYS